MVDDPTRDQARQPALGAPEILSVCLRHSASRSFTTARGDEVEFQFDVPKGMTVELWIDPHLYSLPGPGPFIPAPMDGQPEITRFIRLYKLRIQIEDCKAWFLGFWALPEKTAAGAFERYMKGEIRGLEYCDSLESAQRLLRKAWRWARDNINPNRGRTRRKKSNITPEQEREIKGVMYANHTEGMSNQEIAGYLNNHYPPERYGRDQWNKELVRNWLKEEIEDRQGIDREIAALVNDP